jgi:tetratricopeptide (TPR) repeat protein
MKRFIGLLIAAVLVSCASLSWANELVFETGVDHYNDGVKAQKKGDLEAAFSEYQKAYILFGSQESTYSKFILNNTAVMYAQQGNFANAEELFLQALSIDPDYKQANFNLGMLYAKKGQCTRALQYFTKALNSPGNFMVEDEKEFLPKPQLFPK